MRGQSSPILIRHPVYTSIGTSLLKTPTTSTPRGFKHRKYATVACRHTPPASFNYVSGGDDGSFSSALSRSQSECVSLFQDMSNKIVPISGNSSKNTHEDDGDEIPNLEVDDGEKEEEVGTGKQNLGSYEKKSQGKVNGQRNRLMVEDQQQKHPSHQKPRTPGRYMLVGSFSYCTACNHAHL